MLVETVGRHVRPTCSSSELAQVRTVLRQIDAGQHPQLLHRGVARSDDLPPPVGVGASMCATGPLLVTLGAALFAATNAASTGLYRRGGTVVTLYLIRAVVVYAANGVIVGVKDGRAEAWRVLRLRTGKADTARLAAARGFVTSAMALLQHGQRAPLLRLLSARLAPGSSAVPS